MVLIFSGEADYQSGEETIKTLKIVINIYLLVVILFHCPVVILQLYSQLRKLCR